MKVFGFSIPSSLGFAFSGSLQYPTRRIATNMHLYNTFKYGQGKYGSNFYVKMRDPFRIPHMQGCPEV